MEIKRVLAGGLAALTAGATLALGAGAVTLSDFVTVSGSSMTSPYIVIGTKAAAADTLAAGDIGVALGGRATTTVTVPGTQGVMTVTDGALVQTKSQNLYLGQAFNSTLQKYSAKEQPTLLATGSLTQKDSTVVDYGQRLYIGNQAVQFNRELTAWTDPALNVELTKDSNLYTYVVRFSPAIDTAEIENKQITILGKDYVFSDVDGALNGDMLTLYGASQTVSVEAGSSTTVTSGGSEYVITVVGISDTGETATIDVNGEAFEVDKTDTGSLDITKGDLKAHVKAIRAFKFPAESGSVELFIGSEEMILQNGEKVSLGGTDMDGTLVAIDNSTDTTIKSVTVAYWMEDKEILKTGESFTDPVFEAFDVAFGGIFPELDSASKDVVEISASSDTDVNFKFTNGDGIAYNQVLLYYDDVSNAINASDGSNDVNFCNNRTLTEGEYVVVSDNSEYSYVLVYDNFNSDDEAVLKDVETGTEYPISVDDLGDTVAIGSIDVVVKGFNAAAETIALNNTHAGINSSAVIYTANKAALTVGQNCLGGADSFKGYVTLTESTFETTDDVSEATLNVTITADTTTDKLDTTDVQDTGLAYGMTSDKDGNYDYGVTTAGTYAVRDRSGDLETVTLYTPDEPTPVYVAFGAAPEFSAGEGVTAGSVQQAVKIQNSVTKMESEVNTATLDRNLVVIGGPCANSLVADLLDMSSSAGACDTAFKALYPTEGVIKVVNDAFGSGKMAMVVAGVNRDATRALAVKVMQGTVSYGK